MFAPDTKILIVDDMTTMRKAVKKSLGEMGLSKVSEAADGELAWPEILKALEIGSAYQLIISDWNMPKMKGIDLLRNVRSHPTLGKTPFIMLTAEAEKHLVMEAIQAGVSSYIMKPFTTQGLQEKLKAVYQVVSKGA